MALKQKWQQNVNKTFLMRRLQGFYECNKYTDCVFLVSDPEPGNAPHEIYAHKLVLATASPVFESLFFGNFNTPKIIEITDIHADAFKLMLNYIYTEELHCAETSDNGLNLYYAAKKYFLPDLEAKSRELIKKCMCEVSCWNAYQLGELFDDEDIIKEAWSFINVFFSLCYKHAGDSITENLLIRLVHEGGFHCDEIYLYKLAYSWAARHCADPSLENLRNILMYRGIFQNIRWRFIKPEYVKDIDILTEREKNFLTGLESSCDTISNYSKPRLAVEVSSSHFYRFNDLPSVTHAPNVPVRNFLTETAISKTYITVNKVVKLLSIYIRPNIPKKAIVKVLKVSVTAVSASETESDINENLKVNFNEVIFFPLRSGNIFLNSGIILEKGKNYLVEILVKLNLFVLPQNISPSTFHLSRKCLSPKSKVCVEFEDVCFGSFKGFSIITGVTLGGN